MNTPKFLYEVTQIFKRFSPLYCDDLLIPPEIAALPDGLLPAVLRETCLLMAQKNILVSYEMRSQPDAALGYALVEIDLKEGEKILQTLTRVLETSQGREAGVQLSWLIHSFLQEMAPRGRMKAWVEGALDRLLGRREHDRK